MSDLLWTKSDKWPKAKILSSNPVPTDSEFNTIVNAQTFGDKLADRRCQRLQK